MNIANLTDPATANDGRLTYAHINALFQNGVQVARYQLNGSNLVFWKRLTSPGSYDLATDFFTWNTPGTFNTDFALYSTVADFQADTNRWAFCNYDVDVGFPRDCGVSAFVGGRWFCYNGGTTGNLNVLWIR